MPTIQEFKQQQGVLPGNPGEAQVNPTQYGRQYDALEGLGKQMTNIGAQYLEKQTIAEESDAILARNQEDITALNEEKERLKHEYQTINPDGSVSFDPRGLPETDPNTGEVSYPKSYAKRMAETANSRLSQGVEAMTSMRARQRYSMVTDGIVSQAMVNAQNFEREQTALHLYQNQEKLVNQGAENLFRFPSLENFKSQSLSIEAFYKANKDNLFAGDKAVEEQKRAMHSLVNNGLLRGYLEQNPMVGLGVLGFNKDGKPNENGTRVGPVVDMLNKDEVADWVDRFQSKLRQNNQVKVHQLSNKLNDFKAAAAAGTMSGGVGDVKAIVEEMGALGAFEKDPEMKVRLYADVVGDVITGRAKNQMSGLTNEEIIAVAAGRGKVNPEAWFNAEIGKMSREAGVNLYPEFAAANKAEMAQKVRSAAGHIISERQKDPAKAVLLANPSLQKQFGLANGGLSPSMEQNREYFAATMREQQRLGISKTKLLTNEMSKNIASQVANAKPGTSSLVIDQIKRQVGPDIFHQVMGQVIKDGNLPDYYAVAGYIDDPQAGSAIIEGMRAGKDIDKILADGNFGYKKSEVMDKVNSEFGEIEQALNMHGTSADNLKIAQGIKTAIMYDAAQRIIRGADADAAAKQATDLVFRKKYEVYKGAIVPNDANVKVKSSMDAVTATGWTNYNWARSNFDKLMLPDGPSAKPNASPDERRQIEEEKYNRVRSALDDETAHRWIMSEDNSSVVLNLRDGNRWVPLKFKDGKNVSVDFMSGEVRGSK